MRRESMTGERAVDQLGADGTGHSDTQGVRAKVPGRYGFLSLKWKALLLSSLFLLAGATAFTQVSHYNLKAQFERQRDVEHDRDMRELKALLTKSARRLEQLGNMIPTFSGMQNALTQRDPAIIRRDFEANWPALQLDLGIDMVVFYDAEGELLEEWYTFGVWVPDQEQRAEWVRKSNALNSPVTALQCQPRCAQFAAVPMLIEGERVGVVLLGSTLADMVRSYQEITGNDIGLLVDYDGNQPVPLELPRIVPWNVTIEALTRSGDTLPIVQRLAEGGDLQQLIDGAQHVEVNQRNYEVQLIDLHKVVPAEGHARVLVIRDVSEALASISSATRESLAVGLIGWLVSATLLLMMLWRPMSRLRRLAHHLPLLADGEFGQVRQAISDSSHNSGLSDEIDVLDNTAVSVAGQLEELEEQVEDRNRALSGRMKELARERDFVTNLLDTAQVIILTQDRGGRILKVNGFAETLTGFTSDELKGRDFASMLAVEGLRSDTLDSLRDLALGRSRNVHQESVVPCRDGSMRTITWYHSRLIEHHGDDARVLSVGLDVTERRKAEHRLVWLADHDPLTQLFNRRRFERELDELLAANRRFGKQGALLVVDLDQFKLINDTSGHSAGDALLKLVADRLARRVPEADVLARLGGDEFAIIVRDAGAAEAIAVARGIGHLLEQTDLSIGGQEYRISASIGIALVPEHAETMADLLACADLAMYQAKESGRGQWYLFSESDRARERMHQNVFWKSKVLEALTDDRFVLFYQPIFDIKQSTVSHYEVLLRMRDSGGGLIPPANFIDAAERSGLIHQVDRRVISRALDRLATELHGGNPISFSVNLSAHALRDPDLLDYLSAELDRTAVDPRRLIFEITETAAVEDFAAASDLMLSIKSLGCQFALDDFGVGFSSFYYLKQLPIDFVKIDGSFIRKLAVSLDDQILVRALSQVAQGFGKRTIAEFVEDAETLRLLQSYGIDYAQGHYVGHPRPAEETFPERARRGAR